MGTWLRACPWCINYVAMSLGTASLIDSEAGLKALASERRLQVPHWLKDPSAQIPPHEYGDPGEHDASNQYIVAKLCEI